MATQKITKQLTELIGNTPLLELNKFSENKGLSTPLITVFLNMPSRFTFCV